MVAHGTSSSRRGFSLVEAMLSMIIVSVMMISALTATTATLRLKSTTAARETALALAHELANEIMQAEYEEPADGQPVTFGPEPGETEPPGKRTKFDDVDDYDGWVSSPPRERGGDALPAGDRFERSVEVRFVSADDINGAGHTNRLQDTGLKRIIVNVAGPNGPVRVMLLRSRNGASDREPGEEGTFVRWVGITMQLGPEGRVMNSGTSVLNQIPIETTQ